MKRFLTLAVLILASTFVSCQKEEPANPPKEYFTLWNQCDALSALKAYVEDVTNPNSPNFIEAPDRIATFDMDGTFIGELYPTYFEYNMLEYRGLDDPDYEASAFVKETAQNIRDFVRNGTPLPQEPMAFEMKHANAAAEAYAGMTLAEFNRYVTNYAAKQAIGFEGMTYGESFYKPMLEVFNYLRANGFTSYVVSGSDRLICRALVESLGIAPNRVIGMDVRLKSSGQGDAPGVEYTMGKEEYIVRTDELLIKNVKNNKVAQITQEIGKVPVLSFGNSSGDTAMHNYCLSDNSLKRAAFMLVADDIDRDHADLEEAAKRERTWRDNGFYVISMKHDFKTIYGYHVQKVDFPWD